MGLSNSSGDGLRVVVNAFGETPLDAIERELVIEPQAPPDPATLGSRDAIVAVESAAVAWVDLLMTSGQYQHMPSPPYCPGLEYSGVVRWLGAEVDCARVKVGDRVIADGFLTGPRSKGAYQQWGGFASYAVAPAEALIPLPASFSFDQGASFRGNYETAYHCLFHCGKLREGETVLIHGATGASGLASVQLAKIAGATVIATGRSQTKLDEVKRQGADHVISLAEDRGGIARLKDEVRAIAPRGVDVVYDAVGGDLSIESLRCVAFGARFLIVGWAGTPFVAKGKGGRGAPNANVLPTNLIMMKALQVIGCPTAMATHFDPSIRAARVAALDAWVAEGRLVPLVSKVFPLAEIREAMRDKWASRHVGGTVVHPPHPTMAPRSKAPLSESRNVRIPAAR